jgi:hypothetical protein
MSVFWGFAYVIFGALIIYLGSMQIICGMLPKEQSLQVAEWHGKLLGKFIVETVKEGTPK